MEKLIIKNFGGIKRAEFEVKPFNIIIGKQSTGKSLTMKVLYFFRQMYVDIFRLLHTEKSEFFNTYVLMNFKDRFAFNTKDAFEISYLNFDSMLTIKLDSKISIITEGEVFDYVFNLENTKPHLFAKDYFVDIDDIFNEMQGKLFLRFTSYLISGRSFFSYINENFYRFRGTQIQKDYYVNEFGGILSFFKSHYFKNLKLHDFLKPIAHKILNGELVRENDIEYIKHADGRKVELSFCSSGQQEFLPLLIIINHHLLYNAINNNTLLIEEPEAHLYPTAQKAIIDALAYLFNHKKGKVDLFITTHSPYIISYLNVLLEAGNQKDKQKVVKPELALNFNDLNVMTFNDEGVLVSIMDEENKLIIADEFDKAAEEIENLFTQLMQNNE